jgi:uncharacterized short protein YbdD (DUF466 family)
MAVIYKDEVLGRVLVLEAEPYVGIRLIPLSKYLHNYKDKKHPYKSKITISQLKRSCIKRKYEQGHLLWLRWIDQAL